MNRGFYSIMCAQFLSSLADNALLIAAIALLTQMNAPDWMTPLLKLFFVVSYICLAAYVGLFADSMPKGRVMFLTNMLKVGGCLLMLFGSHPLLAYAVVGIGAAAYSPAKYGILTELLPPVKLVLANSWIEGLTVASIILGVVMGGCRCQPSYSRYGRSLSEGGFPSDRNLKNLLPQLFHPVEGSFGTNFIVGYDAILGRRCRFTVPGFEVG